MACDICGKTGVHLQDLLESHKTKDIQQICGDCERVVTKHKSKLQSVTSNMLIDWLNAFMRQRKKELWK